MSMVKPARIRFFSTEWLSTLISSWLHKLWDTRSPQSKPWVNIPIWAGNTLLVYTLFSRHLLILVPFNAVIALLPRSWLPNPCWIRNPNPSEAEVREAISGVLCRCTGYTKPVIAVLQAAKVLRGEKISKRDAEPSLTHPTEMLEFQSVGKSEPKLDAQKLAQGKSAFTADINLHDLLYAKVLHSPHAHAIIKNIDTSKALALPGIKAVLTWQDLPRVVYSTAGQSDPIPGPLDMFSLDRKVRYVGDRVAFVAAETPELAETALGLIDVEYEILPAVLDMRESMEPGTVCIHDEPEFVPFAICDPAKNLAAEIRIDIGKVENGFAEADEVFEGDYIVPKVQQAHIEPHVVVTWWDEDDRLVIRTSTQVPFHARRILAPVLGIAGQADSRD